MFHFITLTWYILEKAIKLLCCSKKFFIQICTINLDNSYIFSISCISCPFKKNSFANFLALIFYHDIIGAGGKNPHLKGLLLEYAQLFYNEVPCTVKWTWTSLQYNTTQLDYTALHFCSPNNWLPKTLNSVQAHCNITELCPAMVACCYSNLGPPYKKKRLVSPLY